MVALGQRFFDETEGNFSSNNHEQVKDYRYGDYRNARDRRAAVAEILRMRDPAAFVRGSGYAP